MLPKQTFDEFKELYQKDTGIVLTDNEATEQATQLFSAMKILALELLLDNNYKNN